MSVSLQIEVFLESEVFSGKTQGGRKSRFTESVNNLERCLMKCPQIPLPPPNVDIYIVKRNDKRHSVLTMRSKPLLNAVGKRLNHITHPLS